MDKLQEIKGRISTLKGYQNAKPEDQYWMTKDHIDFLIDRTELSVKQQDVIEENKRQQEVTIHQFRQAREEIQRLNQENGRFKKALQIYAAENNYRRTLRMSKWATVEMENRFGGFNPSFMEVDRGQTAREALEGNVE
ncbi:VWA domain-containing protein [Bacillus atrophaeus]|uniref:VWA domain-containing protein n=1 Tax=Bacillus atrophaeus TaxID=1452 RepID=UPI000B08B675|nr:VWA domain-containing protein [Bacillus atrophaeus]MED4806704.1 VWA domain-containing protein [Bacillus atrophaeus]GED03696.1 hypothetical protein BAT02nite_33400 [Bacillus atrophaeus]